MDREELEAEARRETELAELTVLGARERVHDAEHAMAARDLLGSFERLVEGRIGAIANAISREAGAELTAQAERLRDELVRARGAIEAEVSSRLDEIRATATRESSEAISGAMQRAETAATEIGAAEKRVAEAIEKQAREAAATVDARLAALAEETDRAQAAIEERLDSVLEGRLSDAVKQLEARSADLRREIEQALSERVDERVAAKLPDAIEQETKRQRVRREERLAQRLERGIGNALDKRVADAASKVADEQQRRLDSTLEALSRNVRDEFETRVRALEERASEPGGRPG